MSGTLSFVMFVLAAIDVSTVSYSTNSCVRGGGGGGSENSQIY